MSIDIYAPCPCGSGKKFKFCCHALSDDMDRVIRLMEGNQPRVALQQLEYLAQKHPRNPWVGTTRAMLLLDLNEGTTARDVLKLVLEENPDNELAIVLYAAAMIQAEGFEAAKRPIHRAFQRSAKKLPTLVSDLATSLAAAHASRGQIVAAREHLALALRLAPEERRQQLFVQLLELDGADDIPYPLRGSHQLPTITGEGEFEKEVRKAQKYAAIGCWSTAADVFTTLANASPERAELWHAVGLCRIWDGDEKAAADALHKAGRSYSDLGIAVECETIAQILDEKNTTDVVERGFYQAKVPSVSRLLTALDSEPRLYRMKTPAEAEPENPPVATYSVIDSEWNVPDFTRVTSDQIPKVLGQIAIYDANEATGEPGFLVLAGFRGLGLDDSKSLLSAKVGALIDWRLDLPQPEISGSVSTESLGLENHWCLSEKIPLLRRRELFEQFWSSIVTDKWPNQPLKALSGKTPLQAVGDESLKVPLLGAMYALDAAAQRREKGVGLKRLFERLGVAPLPALPIGPETHVGGLTIMQLHRLPISELTDQQLVTVVNRSLLIRHDETLYEVLKVGVDRPNCVEHFDMPRILRTLCEISAAQGRREEAFSWLERGRQLPVPEGKTAFQHSWAWDMAEFATRLEDPSDPKLNELLSRFVNYYGPKVPQIRPHIEQMLAAFGVPSPWDSPEIQIANSLSSSGRGWSPSAPEPVGAGERKLWLPGQ